MGLLDIIPGVSTVKTGLAGIAGLAIGSVMGYFTGSSTQKTELKKLKKEYQSLEEEVEDLRTRIGLVDDVRQARALLRISILRQLAWQDGRLHDQEKLFLYDYVLTCPDLQADIKTRAMLEINVSPSLLEAYWEYIRTDYKSQLFATTEEKEGFKAVLLQLAYIDGNYEANEERFVQKVLKCCGLTEQS